MCSDESDDNNVSERETQFVPRSDDDQVLWTVEEITAERGSMYKVKWAGVDPATKKPWAQSWVPKHDCTDDLVADWKAKRKRQAAGGKRGRGKSAVSRASGSSKRAGSSTPGHETRSSTSDAPSTHLDTIEQHQQVSSAPKRSHKKRKYEAETPATTSRLGVGAVEPEEQGKRNESDKDVSVRPRKKLKTVLEALLPPILSDSDEDGGLLALALAEARAEAALRRGPPKSNRALTAASDEDISHPEAETRDTSARLKDIVGDSGPPSPREESRLPRMKIKAKVVPRREERVATSDRSDGEEPRLSTSKKKLAPKRKTSLECTDDLSEKAVVEIPAVPLKFGPPRGVKRRVALKGPRSTSKHGPSRTEPLEDASANECAPIVESKQHPGDEAFGDIRVPQQDAVDIPIIVSFPSRISIPPVPPSARPRSPDLSPGARARLELFDRMMAEPCVPLPPADVHEHMPGDSHFNIDDGHETYVPLDTFEPPSSRTPSPSKSKSKKSKSGTPNGLIVPETESSGNSQSQPQSSLKPLTSCQPPPVSEQFPRKPVDLPPIAVIATSTTSSFASFHDLIPSRQRVPLLTQRRSRKSTFKPVLQISPGTFRSKLGARSRLAVHTEAPASSIESFTSPNHDGKGKKRAVEEDELKSSLSEGGSTGSHRKRPVQRNTTDSELKRRGQELFDRAQLALEAGRNKKKDAKRLKNIDDIVNGTRASSPPKGLSPPLTGEFETTLWGGMIDLTSGVNSMTVDASERTEARPLCQEEQDRLRIELRREEEESTQEAMGIYATPPMEESKVIAGKDALMPPPPLPKNSPLKGPSEDVDHIEQPSTDLQQASVIVQVSQEQGRKDVDIDPSPRDQPASSPPRPIPENLTDSPKRRLGEALSLLNVKSEEIERFERELTSAHDDLISLNAELAEIRQSSEPTAPVRAAWDAERAQWSLERSKWEKDYSEWRAQQKEMSGEKASLLARVAELSDAAQRAEEVDVKLSELKAERDAMLRDLTQRSEELDALIRVTGEYKQDRSKWEAEKTEWLDEKAKLEAGRAALQDKQDNLSHSVEELTVSVATLTSVKLAAEKDRDFFREQYMQASEFVSFVRAENVELESRVKIAEGQAQEGVASIKTFFEGRINALQRDVDRWKGLTELLQEKDKRTDDNIRMQAAQVPELGELCSRLRVEKQSLEMDLRKLGQAQQRNVVQRNKLYFQIFMLKKERASLKSKLAQLTKMADSSTQPGETSQPVPEAPAFDDTEGIDSNDMDVLPDPMPASLDVGLDEPSLFPCMWRPQWRDQCQQIFDTKEDLERHMQEHFRDLVP